MKLKRLISLLIIAALAFTTLAGCQKTPTTTTPDNPSQTPASATEETAETAPSSLVFREKNLAIDISDGFYVLNGKIYFSKITEEYDENDELISRTLNITLTDNEASIELPKWSLNLTAERDEAAKTETLEIMNTFAVDAEGNLWLATQTDMFDDESGGVESLSMLKKLDAEGNEIFAVNLSEQEDFAGRISAGLELDKDGNAYLQTWSNAGYATYVFDGETGEYIFRTNDNRIEYTAVTAGGRIVSLNYVSGSYQIVSLDAAKKGVGDIIDLGFNSMYELIFNGFGQYDLFAFRADTIYGITLAEFSETPVISFADSNIDTMTGINLFPITEQIFLLAKYDWQNPARNNISKITYDPDAKDDRVKITIGTIDSNVARGLEILAAAFNKACTTARVEVINYGSGSSLDDRILGTEKLDLALVQGNGPDLICMTNLDPQKYIRKGVLSDMTDMLNNDTRINRADLFENVLEAGFTDGRFYQAIPLFNIYTLIGKASLFGDGSDMTVGKINEVLKQYPDADIIYGTSRQYWLRDCITSTFGSYVDWKSGTCSFDTPEFIALLELSKRVPVENNDLQDLVRINGDEAYHNAIDKFLTTFKNNESLLIDQRASEIRSFREFSELFGEEASFLGYPSPDGAQSTLTTPWSCAINEGSQHKVEAWEYISFLLSNEIVNSVFDGYTWINKTKFEEQAAIEMTPLVEREIGGGFILKTRAMQVSDYTIITKKSDIDEERFANYHLTEAEVQKVRDAIGSVNRVDGVDMKAWAIVAEERDAFLSGTRSAEETARIIQNRVGIYMSENS